MITSGSCRSSDRMAVANVNPAFGLICVWRIDGIWYSTGSSTVRMLRSVLPRYASAEYSVVVLPAPVGPVTSTMPRDLLRMSRNSS